MVDFPLSSRGLPVGLCQVVQYLYLLLWEYHGISSNQKKMQCVGNNYDFSYQAGTFPVEQISGSYSELKV